MPIRAFAAGVLSAIVLYAAMKIVRVYDLPVGQYGKLAISLTTFFLGGFAGGRATGRDRSGHLLRLGATAYGALLVGIGVGVVCWNGLEDFVFSRFAESIYQERKLFPVDVMLLWMLGWAPLLCGVVAGIMFRRETTAPRTDAQ